MEKKTLPLSPTLYQEYPAMSAVAHEFEVQRYAKSVAAALEAENAALREKLAAAEARTVLTDERAAFEEKEISYWQSMQPAHADPLTDKEKAYLLRPNNCDKSSYEACDGRWQGWQWRAALAASAAPAAQEDAKRLDWLDQINRRANERNGTIYGWKFDINHNRTRLDDMNYPHKTIREAIDAAIAAAIAANTPKGT